jgi:uncharacterized membrane protein
MEKMLVIVFDEEAKAYEGSRALFELEQGGNIAVHAQTVVQKNNDGSITEKKTEGIFPVGTVAGTALGALMGLIGGPLGLGVGAVIGGTAGVIRDFYKAGVASDFLAEVEAALTPGKYAVIADVEEEWVTPVDVRMEEIGGVVLRTVRQQFEEELFARDAAAFRKEITQVKTELAQAHKERKAKLQAKLDELDRKLEDKLDQAADRAEERKKEIDTKVDALQKKAAAAHGEHKAAINRRITELKEQFKQAETKLRSATAQKLRKAAASVEKAG